MFKKTISLILSLSLIITQPIFAQGLSQLNLAQYLGQIHPSATDIFQPAQLKYFSYDNLNNSYRILLDKGDLKDIKDNQLKEEAKELMDYFLIGLALPNDAFWVNLRPDSPDNIIDPKLEKTDLGRILLEADLQLKKDTAGLTSPQTPEGKAYWDKLYKKAGELFATENITIPTLTRPWIVPGEIIVRESQNSAYIYKATLKVMLEEDYLKSPSRKVTKSPNNQPLTSNYNFTDPRLKELNEYSTQIIRETIIPKITREVNSSKRYAQLRQVYYSLVLSRWFKARFRSQSTENREQSTEKANNYLSLIDSGNLTNLTAKEPYDKLTYFKQYQESFAQGEYNLKEPAYTPYGQSVRSYMSGGFTTEYMNFSGPEIKAETASNPVEQQLLLPLRENTVILDNNFKIVDLKQPLAIAASPLGIKLIDNEDKYSNLRYVEYETLSDLSRAKLWNSFQSVASDANVEDNPEYSWGFAVELNKEEGIGRVLGAVKYKKDTETEPVTYVFGNSSEDIKNITAALKAKTKQKDEVVASPIEFYNEQEAEKWVKGNFKTGSISKYEYLLISNEDFVEMGELAKSIIQTIPKEIDIFQTSGKMAYGIPQTNVPLFHQKNYTIQPEVKGKPRARSISSEDWREVIIYFLAFIVIDDLDSLTTVSETKKSSLEKDAAIIFGEDGDVAFRLTLAQWWGKKYLPGYKSKELTKKQRAFFQKYFSVAASLLTIPEMQALGLTSAQDFMVKNIMPALHNIDVRATLDTTLVRGPDSTEGRARSLLETCKKYMLEFPEKYIQATKIKINKKEIEEVTGTLALYFDSWFTARPENIAAAAGYLSRVMRDKFEEDIIAEGFKRLQQIINSIVENLVNKSDENKALSVIPLDKLIMELAVLKRETESHSAEERFSKLIELMSRVNEKDTEFKCEILDEIFFILTYRVAINNIASYALNNLQNVHGDMFNDYEPKYPTISKVLDAIKEGLKEDRLEILRQLESIGWNENKKISLRKDLETINRFIDTVTSAQKNKDNSLKSKDSASPLSAEEFEAKLKDFSQGKQTLFEVFEIIKIFSMVDKNAQLGPPIAHLIAGILEKFTKGDSATGRRWSLLLMNIAIRESVTDFFESKDLYNQHSKFTIKEVLDKLKEGLESDKSLMISDKDYWQNTIKITDLYIKAVDNAKNKIENQRKPSVVSPLTNEWYVVNDADRGKMSGSKVILDMFSDDGKELIKRYPDSKELYEETEKKLKIYWKTEETYDIQKAAEAALEFYTAIAGIKPGGSKVEPEIENKIKILQDTGAIINGVVEKIKFSIENDIIELGKRVNTGVVSKDLNRFSRELSLKNSKATVNYILFLLSDQFKPYRGDIPESFIEHSTVKYFLIKTELEIFDFPGSGSPLTAERYIINDQDMEEIKNIKYFFKMFPFEAPEFIARIRNPESKRELQDLYQETNKKITASQEVNDIIGASEAVRKFYATVAGIQSQESSIMPKVSRKLIELEEAEPIIDAVVKKMKDLIEVDMTEFEEVMLNNQDIDLTEIESIIKKLNLNNLKPAALEMKELFKKYQPRDYKEYSKKWVNIITELEVFDIPIVSSPLSDNLLQFQLKEILKDYYESIFAIASQMYAKTGDTEYKTMYETAQSTILRIMKEYYGGVNHDKEYIEKFMAVVQEDKDKAKKNGISPGEFILYPTKDRFLKYKTRKKLFNLYRETFERLNDLEKQRDSLQNIQEGKQQRYEKALEKIENVFSLIKQEKVKISLRQDEDSLLLKTSAFYDEEALERLSGFINKTIAQLFNNEDIRNDSVVLSICELLERYLMGHHPISQMLNEIISLLEQEEKNTQKQNKHKRMVLTDFNATAKEYLDIFNELNVINKIKAAEMEIEEVMTFYNNTDYLGFVSPYKEKDLLEKTFLRIVTIKTIMDIPINTNSGKYKFLIDKMLVRFIDWHKTSFIKNLHEIKSERIFLGNSIGKKLSFNEIRDSLDKLLSAISLTIKYGKGEGGSFGDDSNMPLEFSEQLLLGFPPGMPGGGTGLFSGSPLEPKEIKEQAIKELKNTEESAHPFQVYRRAYGPTPANRIDYYDNDLNKAYSREEILRLFKNEILFLKNITEVKEGDSVALDQKPLITNEAQRILNIFNGLIKGLEDGSLTQKTKRVVSSALEKQVGGIDFTDKAMRIGLERMGSFADLKLVLPEIANVAALDLDAEFKQIQVMASSGIRPADNRILEFAAACYYQGEFNSRLAEITSCIQQAHFLDERLGKESSPALRLATMLPEALYSHSLN